MSLGTIILIILILLLVFGVPTGFYGFGNGGGISLGTVLVIVLIFVLLGRL